MPFSSEGDIAYSGKAEEYVHAKTFLEDLAEKVKVTLGAFVGVPETTTWTKPASAKAPFCWTFKTPFERPAPAGIDKKIWNYLGDPSQRAQLLSSIGFQRLRQDIRISLRPSRTHHQCLMAHDEIGPENTEGPKFNDHVQSPRQWAFRKIVLAAYQLPSVKPGSPTSFFCHHRLIVGR